MFGLFAVDFLITRRPHEVSMREAVGWSAFYVALPLGFGGWVWWQYGGERGLEYLTGYLVEKSLSVDNLFVFMLLLAAFAVPAALQQRVLLYGIAGALVLRGVFIALGAAALQRFDWAFLLFGAVLLVTAVKVLPRRALPATTRRSTSARLRSVRLLRRFLPVTDVYARHADDRARGRPPGADPARRWSSSPSSPPTWSSPSTRCRPSTASPMTRTWSSRPTPSPCSACGRSTSSVEGALGRLATSATAWPRSSAFIGVKLVLHWAHTVWPSVPSIPTLALARASSSASSPWSP